MFTNKLISDNDIMNQFQPEVQPLSPCMHEIVPNFGVVSSSQLFITSQ